MTSDEDQFEWPRSEMRGLIVDEQTGKVIARPFQKFWSITEKQAGGTDWSEPHVVLPKLDGSLVYPAAGRWVTRGGVTDTSQRAEALARGIGEPLEKLLERLRTDPADGAACTPCFEYIGPDNRIVVAYDRPRLVLLAVRRIGDGRYWPWERRRNAFETSEQASGLRRRWRQRRHQSDPGREYAQELADEIAVRFLAGASRRSGRYPPTFRTEALLRRLRRLVRVSRYGRRRGDHGRGQAVHVFERDELDDHPRSVHRDDVLCVLRLHDVEVAVDANDASVYILVKGEVADAQALPEQVTRHLLGRFASKFGFSMGDFFALRHMNDQQGNPPAGQQPKP